MAWHGRCGFEKTENSFRFQMIIMSMIDDVIDGMMLKEAKKGLKHPLRRILEDFDSQMLGKLLDAFGAVYRRDFSNLDGASFAKMRLYVRIESDPEFVKEECPRYLREDLCGTKERD